MAEKKFLLRDDILQAHDLPFEDVEVPEWGGWVRVRGLTGEERDKLEADMLERRGDKLVQRKEAIINFRARLVAMTAIDENGNRLFTEQDIVKLSKKSAVALQRVFDVAMKLAGLRQEDMDELLGNSENDQSGDSTSD